MPEKTSKSSAAGRGRGSVRGRRGRGFNFKAAQVGTPGSYSLQVLNCSLFWNIFFVPVLVPNVCFIPVTLDFMMKNIGRGRSRKLKFQNPIFRVSNCFCFLNISFLTFLLTMTGVRGRVPDPGYLFDADPDYTSHFFPDPYPWLRVHFETL
jgi:hypothetical protein